MKRFILGVVVLTGLALSADAGNRLEFNLMAGIMSPSGSGGVEGTGSDNVSNATVEGAGASLSASLFYWFGRHWALGFEGGLTQDVEVEETYQYRAPNPFGTVELKGTSEESMVHILTGLKIGTQPTGDPKKPNGYFFLGGGLYSRDQDTSMIFEGSKTVGFSTTHVRLTNVPGYSIDCFGFVPGVGFSFPMGKHAALGFDLRYHILNQDGIRFLNPMVHLSF